jgi:signal peptidase II
MFLQPLYLPTKLYIVKGRNVFLIILAVIVIDQVLKIWIKTHYPFGHVKNVMGLHWFQLYFIENEGMAWGYKWGGELGKLILTLFRLVAVVFGVFYIHNIIRKKYHKGFIIFVALILGGALGNLIDSMFYGLIFEETNRTHVAGMFTGHGYAGFLHGRVVDMLYFPLIQTHLPSWFPFVGGKEFTFFDPVFNIADTAISTGVITILVFQKRFFKSSQPSQQEQPTHQTLQE